MRNKVYYVNKSYNKFGGKYYSQNYMMMMWHAEMTRGKKWLTGQEKFEHLNSTYPSTHKSTQPSSQKYN